MTVRTSVTNAFCDKDEMINMTLSIDHFIFVTFITKLKIHHHFIYHTFSVY